MVGAAPVCQPESPRSGVSIRKRHIPHPQKRRFHVLKCLYIAHDAHLLSMDAPLQGDTGGHTGTAPTNLHQTLSPRNLPRLIHRRTIRRHTFHVFVRRRTIRRQSFRVLVRRWSLCRRHATRYSGRRGEPGNIAATDVAR